MLKCTSWDGQNNFGKLLWKGGSALGIQGRQFRWVEEKYDVILKLCRVSNYFHVVHEPLRMESEIAYLKFELQGVVI